MRQLFTIYWVRKYDFKVRTLKSGKTGFRVNFLFYSFLFVACFYDFIVSASQLTLGSCRQGFTVGTLLLTDKRAPCMLCRLSAHRFFAIKTLLFVSIVPLAVPNPTKPGHHEVLIIIYHCRNWISHDSFNIESVQ